MIDKMLTEKDLKTELEQLPVHFTESIYYELELTSKYCRLMGQQFFELMNVGLTPDEFAALDIILHNEDMCQRDLAKMLLKDRANTGRIIASLEEKGCLERFVDTKNNRLVRKMKVTALGLEKMSYCTKVIIERHKTVEKYLSQAQVDDLKQSLTAFRNALSQIVDIQI